MIFAGSPQPSSHLRPRQLSLLRCYFHVMLLFYTQTLLNFQLYIKHFTPLHLSKGHHCM